MLPCFVFIALYSLAHRAHGYFLPPLEPKEESHNATLTPSDNLEPSAAALKSSLFDMDLAEFSPVLDHSVTALLPVTSDSASNLGQVLSTLLAPSTKLLQVIVTCPEPILSGTRNAVRKAMEVASYGHPEVTLIAWPRGMDENTGMLYVASEASTNWVILLDIHGLEGLSDYTRNMLTYPMDIPHSVGPRGVLRHATNTSCLTPSDQPQAASFLIPPFIVPSHLIPDEDWILSGLGVWAAFGQHISESRLDALGAIVLGSETSKGRWCHTARRQVLGNVDGAPEAPPGRHNLPSMLDVHHARRYNKTAPPVEQKPTTTGTAFLLLFPHLGDLQAFSAAACRLQVDGHTLRILLYDVVQDSSTGDNTLVSESCTLHFDTMIYVPGQSRTHLSDWLDVWSTTPAIILTLAEEDAINANLVAVPKLDRYPLSTWICIPQRDLLHTAWMGAMSLQEWRNWHVPRIDVSVITKDRPRSLERLLSSLSDARYFGDVVSVRINLEQTSDTETLQVVDSFRWNQGPVFVHHRVIHGGLLPAVVESWYPHSNDSYGLILEDDVELSPLFYAWAKMCILRYRYGALENRTPQLFGISLYQQKNLELHMDGRRAFNARTVFAKHDFPHPTTPYLSQIPCSWGAVYFPEHWREFHAYLAVRLSEFAIGVDEDVVPDVRSNRWTKSWKKFFIELVYLRGYLMLYPNFPDFVSLSTNHLEVGSHVKDRPSHVYLKKKDLFHLPLMAFVDDQYSSAPPTTLLDLPNHTLPPWHELPVLDLVGSLSSSDALIHRGFLRRGELTNCPSESTAPHDVRDLMCIYEDLPSLPAA
ncbi:hypothetical protein PLICRDRAFT_247694 [Plicaturopsis crispa FD-325 SS-3]|nr:hypothetical protein PLICRDRAFT_247694 [Plicaturopsis crispa FD-325 SS-3]